MTKYKLSTADELIKQANAIEKCVKKLDEALGVIVCIDAGERSIIEWLKNEIYGILSDVTLDNYISEMGGGMLCNIYQLKNRNI